MAGQRHPGRVSSWLGSRGSFFSSLLDCKAERSGLFPALCKALLTLLSFKNPCDYIWPTGMMQGNNPYLKLIKSHLQGSVCPVRHHAHRFQGSGHENPWGGTFLPTTAPRLSCTLVFLFPQLCLLCWTNDKTLKIATSTFGMRARCQGTSVLSLI